MFFATSNFIGYCTRKTPTEFCNSKSTKYVMMIGYLLQLLPCHKRFKSKIKQSDIKAVLDNFLNRPVQH